VRKIRTALGDDSAKPRFLETVVGKGYRFVGPLRVIDSHYPRSDLERQAQPTVSSEKVGGWGERSSLAVLPLSLVGSGTDDRGLCLGFADALVTRLGNLQGVDVLPTSAVLGVSLEATASEIAARQGVRFVVRGAIQMSKGLWRLSLELFDSRLHRSCFTRKFDLDLSRLSDLEDEVAKQIAATLNRPLGRVVSQRRPRYSRDPLAYEEFMRGYRLSASGDPALLEDSARHLVHALARDPAFSLAHAVLSFVCATRHFEFDPATTTTWLEKADFHCQGALELDPDLPEGYVARAYLLWGPSKNFQHLEAIAELKRAIALQNNLPHAYNRLGTILAHIGLLDHARTMYERARPFDPKKAVSHSIVQVYVWNQEYELAREEIKAWRAESPANKYPVYFAPQVAMMTGDWKEAKVLLELAECMMRACAIPKSFGHSHHTYYQIAGILSLLGRRQAAFEWLERSVSAGFACWPFFLKDPCLQKLRNLPEFEVLVSCLQARYPDRLGVL